MSVRAGNRGIHQDTNCQYYGSWRGRRNLQYKGHPDFRPVPAFATATSMTSPIPEEKR